MTAHEERAASEMRDEMRKEMALAARDLLGTGYVPEYYESAASDFAFIAESYANDVLASHPASRPTPARAVKQKSRRSAFGRPT